ncbi:MAG TPA: hypothetical protein VFQ85_09385 [Mycobacteriales bacterium]|jgi:hypothetical protein|nr:hypothetical protein [Mycobacteriales bacterium]
MRRWRVAPLAVVAVVTSLTVGACATSRPKTPAAPAASGSDSIAVGGSVAPTAGLEKSPRMPLDAFSLDSDDDAALLSAYRHIIHKCMRARGFTPPADGGVTTGEQLDRARANAPARQGEFGLVDPEQAARYGYSAGPMQKITAGAGAESSWEGQLRKYGPAYLRALYGYDDPARASAPDKDSCRAVADRELDVPANGVDVDLQGRLALEAAERTRSDPRVIVAFEAWSRCMAGRGYRFREPTEPFRAQWPRPTPSAAEIATAKTDVACKQQTRLYAIWLETERSVQAELVERHGAALAELRAFYERRVRRAQEVLRG